MYQSVNQIGIGVVDPENRTTWYCYVCDGQQEIRDCAETFRFVRDESIVEGDGVSYHHLILRISRDGEVEKEYRMTYYKNYELYKIEQQGAEPSEETEKMLNEECRDTLEFDALWPYFKEVEKSQFSCSLILI
jgi:hypothetical protein